VLDKKNGNRFGYTVYNETNERQTFFMEIYYKKDKFVEKSRNSMN
jgi:hypothetical protein